MKIKRDAFDKTPQARWDAIEDKYDNFDARRKGSHGHPLDATKKHNWHKKNKKKKPKRIK